MTTETRRVIILKTDDLQYIVGTESAEGTYADIEHELSGTVKGQSRAYMIGLNLGERLGLPVYDQWPGGKPFLIQGYPLKGFPCPREAFLKSHPSGLPSND